MRQLLTFIALLALAGAAIFYSVSPQYPVKLGLDLQGGMRVTLEPDRAKMPPGQVLNAEVMEQVRGVLENRVNSFGLSGAELRVKGSDQILVQLPGAKNPEEALAQISKVAQLELRHFVNVRGPRNMTARYEMSMAAGNAQAGEPDKYTFRDAVSGKPADAKEVIAGAPLIVKGNDLKPTSRAVIDPTAGKPIVTFELRPEAARVFADFTIKNQGEILAIILDDEVISAPSIDTPITEGNGQISGSSVMAEAKVLSNLLNSGALPIPMKAAETQVVGATLGQESINRSIMAGLVGIAIVALFMLLYYWLPGFVACIALVMYAALTFALFKAIGLVLDLPGITGFILSIGMAVDGNILIFERMKEELAAGKPLSQAIQTGFTRAFGAILDSNVTVWIIALILVMLGSPMVKGFAITLALGNAVAMFTAITVTRALLLLLVEFAPFARNIKLYAINNSWLALVFPQWRQGAVLRIYEKRKLYFTISGVLATISVVFIFLSPFGMGLKPGIDFTGGSVIEAAFRDPAVTREQVVTALEGAGVRDAVVRIGKSQATWTTVNLEATDVTPTDQARIREHLEKSQILTGFDPDAYKAETTDKTLKVTATFTSPVTQANIQRALTSPLREGDAAPALKGLKLTTQEVAHSGAQAIPVAEISTRQLPPTELSKLQEKLAEVGGGVIKPMSGTNSIGPSIAREVTQMGIISTLAALGVMILFLALRFTVGGFQSGLRFGVGAAFAIVQDVLIVVGFFAVMGQVLGWQVDSLFLTACLGLLGFAVNDVIVVYDRIRENHREKRRGEPFADIANRAMTQSFDRSFNTNFFIILSLAAMAIFGGESLRLFNIAILVGLVVASFTSIFVATPLVVSWERAAALKAGVVETTEHRKTVRRDPATATTPRRDSTGVRPSSTTGATGSRGVATVDRPVTSNGGGSAPSTESTEDRSKPRTIQPRKKRRL